MMDWKWWSTRGENWREEVEQDIKQHLTELHAPLDDWDKIVEKARRLCKDDYAYHAWIIKVFAGAHPDFVKEAGIKMHWEKRKA